MTPLHIPLVPTEHAQLAAHVREAWDGDRGAARLHGVDPAIVNVFAAPADGLLLAEEHVPGGWVNVDLDARTAVAHALSYLADELESRWYYAVDRTAGLRVVGWASVLTAGRIIVDELQRWPTKIRCFKDGSCHLMVEADEHGRHDLETLHTFAASLGMRRSWYQFKGAASQAHYDLTASRREMAIGLGAVFVPWRQQAALRIAIRHGVYGKRFVDLDRGDPTQRGLLDLHDDRLRAERDARRAEGMAPLRPGESGLGAQVDGARARHRAAYGERPGDSDDDEREAK